MASTHSRWAVSRWLSFKMPVIPRMPLMGVLISRLMLEMKPLLAWLPSSERRASSFTVPTRDWTLLTRESSEEAMNLNSSKKNSSSEMRALPAAEPLQ